MGYIKEFSDKIMVPHFLLTPPWTDESFHNDVCPRFENLDLYLAVWVDFDDPEEREYDDWKKFTVVELIPRLNDTPALGEETLFDTEDEASLRLWLTLHETHRHLEGALTALYNMEKPEETIADELMSLLQMVKDSMSNLK